MDARKTQIMHAHETPPVCVTVMGMKGSGKKDAMKLTKAARK